MSAVVHTAAESNITATPESTTRRGGSRLRVVDLRDNSTHYITFPEAAYAVSPTQNAEFDTPMLRFAYSSMITPQSTYDYDMSTRQRELKKRLEVPTFDPRKYEVKRFMVTARDGVKVPVCAHRPQEQLEAERKHPLLLYAYGSYGSTTEAAFNSGVLSRRPRLRIRDRPHPRREEMGRQWYDAQDDEEEEHFQ